MTSRLRAVRRLLALALWTLICYLGVVLSLPLRRHAPRWQLRIRNRIFRAWAGGVGRILNMRTVVEGTPPSGAFFLISNHVSYMDVILLATQVHATFVAKADLRSWPILGRVIASADTIFVDRERRRDLLRVMELIAGEIDRDLGVVLFPEGTSSEGTGILPFKPSLLEYPARRDYPVHYASLSYSIPRHDGLAHELICWWGGASFLPHVLRLAQLRGFEARLVFGPVPIQGTDRKALADELRNAMEAHFIPTE